MGGGLHGKFGKTKGFMTIIKRINEEDYLQHKLNYIYNGEKNFIPKYTIFNSKPKSIAGKGSLKPLRKEKELIKKYGGRLGEWSKKVVKIKSQKYEFDIHYYQRNRNQYMAKVKSRKERK